jgi:hypothetical protein
VAGSIALASTNCRIDARKPQPFRMRIGWRIVANTASTSLK